MTSQWKMTSQKLNKSLHSYEQILFLFLSKYFSGYYADEEAECQVFHICTADGQDKYSFLCPNGTIFNQNYFIRDWWFNVDCAESAGLAEARNNEIAAAAAEVDELAAAASDTEEV